MRHLNIILRVDGDLVHFCSANTRELLTQKPSKAQKMQGLHLLSQGRLASLCLQYVSEVVSKVSEDSCLAQVSWRERIRSCNEPQAELDFLEYAVRHWPTHYHAHIQLRDQRKTLNPQNETNEHHTKPENKLDGLDSEVLAFLTHDFIRKEWYQMFSIKSVSKEDIPDDIGALEVAVELGLSPVVDRLLTSERAEVTDDTLTTPSVLENLLHTSVRHNHDDLVDLFLHKGAMRYSAILEAASLGRVDYLEKLLPIRSPKDGHEHTLESALQEAARAGNLLTVEYFAKECINWTWKDLEERTILHAAAIGGKVDILKHVINERVLNIDAKDKDGSSPLMLATKLNHALLVEELCKQGADVTLNDTEGDTALHHGISKDQKPIDLAAANGHLDVFQILYQCSDLSTNEELVTQSCSMRQLLVVRFLLSKTKDTNFLVKDVSPLAVAAEKGYTEIVRRKADPNFVNKDNRAPLHGAVSRGHRDVAIILLDAGADPDPLDGERWTPLHRATTQGMVKVVDTLLKHGANVNRRTPAKDTALHMAVAYPEIVRKLLKCNPELDAVNYSGLTPLHRAVMERCVETVKLLVKKDSDLISIPDEDGYTPLHTSIADKHYTREVFETLFKTLSSKAPGDLNVYIQSFHHVPLIMYAIKKENLEVVRFLIARIPGIISSTDSKGVSAFHVAARMSSTEILDELIRDSEGLNVNESSKDGQRPLHFAAAYGGENTIRRLISLGAEINAVDYQGYTALYSAAWRGRSKIVTCLLEAGADPSICTETTWTALHGAADSAPTLEALLSHGAEVDSKEKTFGWTPLMRAVYWDSEMGIRTLLAHNATDITTNSGRTALHLAGMENNPELNRILLEASADANVADDSDMTPLHYAIQNGSEEERIAKVQQLLEHGAVVNCRDNKGATPLHYTATMSVRPLVQALVKAYREEGLNIDEKDNNQETPLHMALYSGTHDIMEILLENGARLDERAGDGRSCLVLAAASDDSSKQKVEFLLDANDDKQVSSPRWTLDDKVDAFMAAVDTDRLDTAKVLAQNDKGTFRDENDTFSILGRCIQAGEYQEA